jgi:hypothetical protein
VCVSWASFVEASFTIGGGRPARTGGIKEEEKGEDLEGGKF